MFKKIISIICDFSPVILLNADFLFYIPQPAIKPFVAVISIVIRGGNNLCVPILGQWESQQFHTIENRGNIYWGRIFGDHCRDIINHITRHSYDNIASVTDNCPTQPQPCRLFWSCPVVPLSLLLGWHCSTVHRHNGAWWLRGLFSADFLFSEYYNLIKLVIYVVNH